MGPICIYSLTIVKGITIFFILFILCYRVARYRNTVRVPIRVMNTYKGEAPPIRASYNIYIRVDVLRGPLITIRLGPKPRLII